MVVFNGKDGVFFPGKNDDLSMTHGALMNNLMVVLRYNMAVLASKKGSHHDSMI